MSSDSTLISVIVPSVRSSTIAATIDAIREQTDTDWELVVSDQSGNDSLVPILESVNDPRIRRVVCPGRGASLARNVGIMHSVGNLLAFTDDDCRPRKDWLATIRKLFAADPDMWMATGSIIPPPNMPKKGIHVCPSYIPDERRHRASDPGYRLYSVTANAAYRREAFTKAGPFDICLSPGTEFGGGEEDDHGSRMELFDPVFLSTPRMEVEHTYGIRSGAKAAWNIKRNYAISVGAIAGKRSLLGDPDGMAMVTNEIDMLRLGITRPWTGAVLRSLPRIIYIRRGYNRMCEAYDADREKRLLMPKGSTLQEVYGAVLPLLDYTLPREQIKASSAKLASAEASGT